MGHNRNLHFLELFLQNKKICVQNVKGSRTILSIFWRYMACHKIINFGLKKKKRFDTVLVKE